MLISGIASAQRLQSYNNQSQFDSTTVGTVGSKVTVIIGYPVSNINITFNSLVALDSIKFYQVNYYGDTVLQKFKLSTSDTLKTLLTGFSGVTQVLIDNPCSALYILRANAVALTTTRVVYIRTRGIYELN